MIDEKIKELIKMYHTRLIWIVDSFGITLSDTAFSFVSDDKKFNYSFIYENEKTILTIESGEVPKEIKKIHGEYIEVEQEKFSELHVGNEIEPVFTVCPVKEQE